MSLLKTFMAFVGLWPEDDNSLVEADAYISDSSGYGLLGDASESYESDIELESVDHEDTERTHIDLDKPLDKPTRQEKMKLKSKKNNSQEIEASELVTNEYSSEEISCVSPTSFSDAKEIADEFATGDPVIMDLSDLDKPLARRLIDFASGICYALDGAMEKIAPNTFLLTPEGAQVSEEEKSKLVDA